MVVDFYREVGFLPEAIVNYLALLGWSLDDKTEHFHREDLVEHFSLDRVNKAAASFDAVKLQSFQDRHMQELPLERKAAMVMPFLERAGLIAAPAGDDDRARVEALVAAAGDRIKVAGDVLDFADFFTPDDEIAYDEKAFDKRIRHSAGAVELLARFRAMLAEVEPFDAATLERTLARVRRGRGRGDRPDHPRPAGRRDRQGRRPRDVRHPGPAGQEPVASRESIGRWDGCRIRPVAGSRRLRPRFSEPVSGLASASFVSAHSGGIARSALSFGGTLYTRYRKNHRIVSFHCQDWGFGGL